MESITKVFSDLVKPYIDTKVQNLSTVISKNGAKNYIPFPYAIESKATGYNVSDLGDGGITISGTSTIGSSLLVQKFKLPVGTYKFTCAKDSDAPIGANTSSAHYYMFIYGINGSSSWVRSDQDIATRTFTVTDANAEILLSIYVANGDTAPSTSFYPMVRLASDTDPTYQPWAMTNQQLTQAITYSRGYLPIVDLGTSYTQELKDDISSGTFKKAVVGGKLTINGHVYYLAHPDYWLKTGDTECTTHHMLVVPAGSLGSGKMNSDDSTAGGYAGSGLKSGTNHDDTANTALADVAAIIKADFGAANILTHREYFTNAVANGKPSGGAFYDSDIDLMNENMVYGTNIFLPHPDGSTVPNLFTIDKTQIKLFAERPDLITNRGRWWLRDIVSVGGFADVYTYGYANYANAPTSEGIRPVFAIC